jgi:hypothetical protein
MSRPELDAIVNRLVTPEELREALDGPISAEERQETLDLVRWFTTRYPTCEARLAYVRRAYARWRTPGLPPDV